MRLPGCGISIFRITPCSHSVTKAVFLSGPPYAMFVVWVPAQLSTRRIGSPPGLNSQTAPKPIWQTTRFPGLVHGDAVRAAAAAHLDKCPDLRDRSII